MRASSMNFIGEIKKPYRVDRAFSGKRFCLGRHHADGLLAVWALEIELDPAVHLRVKRVVLADADVVAGMNLGSALADDDAAGGDELPAVALHAEALGLGIAAVAGAAACLLVCHGLSFSYAPAMPVTSISV